MVELGVCSAHTEDQELLPHARIIRQPPLGPCEAKTRMHVLSSSLIAYRVGIHSSCLHNERAALVNRHLIMQANVPDRNYIRQCSTPIMCKINLGHLDPITPYAFAELYSGGKRAVYRRAAEKVSTQSFDKSWALVSMFVKPDKYPVAVMHEKAPRAIQHRTPEYTLTIGRYLHVFEKNLYQYPDGPSQTPFIAKGQNPQQRAATLLAKISSFQRPLFICLDHSKFDSSIAKVHLKLEHALYNRHFKSNLLRQALRLQLNNIGYSKGGIKYKVSGTRMSGDYNTGLGNSLINYLCLRSFLLTKGVEGEIFLDGDDSIVIIEKADLPKLDFTHFARWGFKTKWGVTENVAEVEFCQSRLIPSVPTMARNPFRALAHLAVSVKGHAPVTWPKIMAGRAICEMVGSRGSPILHEYGKALLRTLPGGTKVVFEEIDKWKAVRGTEEKPITDEVRIDYYNSWGIDPYMQELIEESFSDPTMFCVGKVNSDKYDTESLHRAWEAWSAMGPDRGEHWCSGGEGGMEIL